MNFLALLGWSPGDDRELMSVDELIESFSLEGISGGNAVFNTEKLDWMNGQYIARLPIEALAAIGATVLRARRVWTCGASDPWFHRLLDLLRPRAKRLTDFVDLARRFSRIRLSTKLRRSRSICASPAWTAMWRRLPPHCASTDPFDEPHVEAAVRGTAAERGIKAGTLIHATRVAVTGRTASPGLFEVLVSARP